MKRISYAVGLEELEETYRSVLEQDGDSLPVKMIDYAIKLDHFSHFPKPELQGIIEASRKNAFALRWPAISLPTTCTSSLLTFGFASTLEKS